MVMRKGVARSQALENFMATLREVGRELADWPLVRDAGGAEGTRAFLTSRAGSGIMPARHDRTTNSYFSFIRKDARSGIKGRVMRR